MAKVSIIVPIYNMKIYLKECLNSLTTQTLQDIEIICVNDGSTDSSLEILNEYAQKDNRFVIINQENQGTGAARNAGLDTATGDYIMFCDPDDWYELDACEKAYNYINKNESDIAFYKNKYYDESKNKYIGTSDFRIKPYKNVPNPNHINLATLDTHYMVSATICAAIYSRKFLDKNNIRFNNTRYSEDFLFSIKTYLLAKYVSVLDDAIYIYRQQKKSITHTANNWKEIYYNIETAIDFINTLPNKQLYEHTYLPCLINYIFFSYNQVFSVNPMLGKNIYSETKRLCLLLNSQYDISKVKHLIDYKRFKDVLKYGYFTANLRNSLRKIIPQIFSLTNVNTKYKSHKVITILGIKLKIRKKTKIEQVKQNYKKLLRCLYRNKKRNFQKLKVLFLVNETSKWKSQSLYDLLKSSKYFEPIIALTIADRQTTLTNAEKQEVLHKNFKYFTNQGLNCLYAYDFKHNKPSSLKSFNPKIVFYQQPWRIAPIQDIPKVSKYAFCCYMPYYIPNYGILNMDCQQFHAMLFRYYVLNDNWADIYKKYLKTYAGEILGVGHTFLDYFYLSKNKTNNTKNYVIYAPHWSICDKNNTNQENYSTFDKNGKEILEYAKKHPEINWVFKPHPTLKIILHKIGKMTPEDIEEYYSEWEKIGTACYDGNYLELFRQSKAIITDCASFLIEYFATGKPIIHLISSANSSIPPEPSKIIFDTFYKAHNMPELYDILDKVLIQCIDEKKQQRMSVLKNSKLLNNYAAENIILDLSDTFGIE